MGANKNSVKKRLKKAAEKKKQREELRKLNKSNSMSRELYIKKENESIDKSFRELLAEFINFIKHLEVCRSMGLGIYGFINTVVSSRLDLPYLTEEICDTFRGYHTRSKELVESITKQRDTMMVYAKELQQANKPYTNDPDDIMKNISVQMTTMQKFMTLSNEMQNQIDYANECGLLAQDVKELVNKTNELYELSGDKSIMPIANESEIKMLDLHTALISNTRKIKNSDTGSSIESDDLNVKDDSNEVEENKEEEEKREPVIEDSILNNLPEDSVFKDIEK